MIVNFEGFQTHEYNEEGKVMKLVTKREDTRRELSEDELEKRFHSFFFQTSDEKDNGRNSKGNIFQMLQFLDNDSKSRSLVRIKIPGLFHYFIDFTGTSFGGFHSISFFHMFHDICQRL